MAVLRELCRQFWCLLRGHCPIFEYSHVQARTILRCTRCFGWTEVPW